MGRGVVWLWALALAFLPATAFASCEANFRRLPNLGNMRQFASRIDVQGLSQTKAFAQLKTAFVESRIRLTSEDIATGRLYAQTAAAPLYPAQSVAVQYSQVSGWGTVQLVFGMHPDAIATEGWMRRRICATLNQLTSPARQVAQASLARATPPPPRPARASSLPAASSVPAALTRTAAISPSAPSTQPQAIEAIQLARQVAQVRDNPARIASNFKGRLFRLSGKVLHIEETWRGFLVEFEGTAISSQRDDDVGENRMLVVCEVPKANISAAAVLSPQQPGTLTGRFFRLENHSVYPTITLEQCGA